MQVTPITWEYEGQESCLWKGKTTGLLRHCFFITPTGRDEEAYLLSTDINGVANETCLGLENTKAKAQDLLNSYAISLILP